MEALSDRLPTVKKRECSLDSELSFGGNLSDYSIDFSSGFPAAIGSFDFDNAFQHLAHHSASLGQCQSSKIQSVARAVPSATQQHQARGHDRKSSVISLDFPHEHSTGKANVRNPNPNSSNGKKSAIDVQHEDLNLTASMRGMSLVDDNVMSRSWFKSLQAELKREVGMDDEEQPKTNLKSETERPSLFEAGSLTNGIPTDLIDVMDPRPRGGSMSSILSLTDLPEHESKEYLTHMNELFSLNEDAFSLAEANTARKIKEELDESDSESDSSDSDEGYGPRRMTLRPRAPKDNNEAHVDDDRKVEVKKEPSREEESEKKETRGRKAKSTDKVDKIKGRRGRPRKNLLDDADTDNISVMTPPNESGKPKSKKALSKGSNSSHVEMFSKTMTVHLDSKQVTDFTTKIKRMNSGDAGSKPDWECVDQSLGFSTSVKKITTPMLKQKRKYTRRSNSKSSNSSNKLGNQSNAKNKTADKVVIGNVSFGGSGLLGLAGLLTPIISNTQPSLTTPKNNSTPLIRPPSGVQLRIPGPVSGERKPGWIGAYSPEARKAVIKRYLEKRKKRVWTKKIKYEVRKSFADSRLRVKGRFISKEDEAQLREGLMLAY